MCIRDSSFSEYALNNDYNLLKLEKINRTNSDFQNETVVNAFNNKLNQPFKILTSDGEIGIGVVTEIVMPRNQISDDFYNSVKININKLRNRVRFKFFYFFEKNKIMFVFKGC